jgi:two-component system sensor histidine kinase KdpD
MNWNIIQAKKRSMNLHPLHSQTTNHPPGRLHEKPEASHSRGKLNVFLGYAPGTGKTLAMLEDAFRRQQDGADVVVGYVDAHAGSLAAELLARFEKIPQQVVSPSGLAYQGMDLDAVLARRPQLVLVDHLPWVNPSGLRHIARYLEVEELLNSGIDVYTTVNIYQVESQADAVSYLTGVVVHETVPDRFVDEADQLKMVDLPPQELLARYQGKKIFVSPRAQPQMEKFFQPGNLFALRELALRYVAQRSNTFMRSYLEDRGLAHTDTNSTRLLVCISANPAASSLVRAGRRMADETRADWTVIYVETPEEMAVSAETPVSTETPVSSKTPISAETAAEHLRLAETLGAKTEILTGRSVVEAVREYAYKNHIRQIMVGRSIRRRWWPLSSASIAEQLLRDDPTINVYVVGSDQQPRPYPSPGFRAHLSGLHVLGSLLLVVLPTLLGVSLTPMVISRSANLVMLYLLSVAIASIFLGLIPALLTAALSALAFDFFFVPPLFQLLGFAPENAITFISLLVVSIIISTLVSRERLLTRAAQSRATQVTQLYELSRDLATAVDMPDILNTVLRHIRQTFDREAVILLPRNGKLELSESNAASDFDQSELTAAEWAFQQGRPAGNETGTFSYASFRYFPLETSRGIVGVLGICLDREKPSLSAEQMRQLGAYVTKAASSVERALFAEEASQAEILRATDRLQTALLNSISHDLRTPLASITGVLSSLRMEEDLLGPETRRELIETAFGEAERLNRLVGNLLDMTRLESGSLKISLQPCDVQDVIGSALNALGTRLDGHEVRVEVPPDLPLIPLDYVLINQVLINLLDNAAKYSPETGEIRINVGRRDNAVVIAVEDQGPGIPEEDLSRIFEKFYRVKRFENVVGTGLGLSICKGIIEAHSGKIWAENRSVGGSRFVIRLPIQTSQYVVRESNVKSLQEEVRS